MAEKKVMIGILNVKGTHEDAALIGLMRVLKNCKVDT